jgi:2-polyprenyl-6-methoxyphenol hydroxylase-like FAD-dependent oxidoreductase
VQNTHIIELPIKQDAQIDVLICGAGATGLTLAIELARRHVSFRLIDARHEPFHGSRGKGIQPRSQEIFEDLGILDRIVAMGSEYPPQRAYRDDGTYHESLIMERQNPTPGEPYHIPLLIPQFLTERVMRERLAELGHQPEFARALNGFTQDADGVLAAIARSDGSEEQLRARYLVGADGGRSLVRHTLDIGFPGKTLGMRAIVADVHVDGVSRDAWHRFNEGSMETQIALCPLPGTEMFQLQAPVPLEGDIDLSAPGLTALFAVRTGRTDIVVQSVSWASAFNMNARLADRYRRGRVFLAGDAAHIHPPTGGQGLNTSVQDAYNLGWKLAAVLAGAPDALLDTFEEERRPIAAQMLGLTAKLLDAATRGKTRRGREVHQLDLGYPESSLALESPARHEGILVGDRAPDAPLRGAAGQPTRLFNLCHGMHWTLIGYRVDRTLAPPPHAGLHVHVIDPDGDVVDDGAHFRSAYGVTPGDWVLIRPDGYVGAIVSSAQIAALSGYFDRVGIRKIEPAYRNTSTSPQWMIHGCT